MTGEGVQERASPAEQVLAAFGDAVLLIDPVEGPIEMRQRCSRVT